MEFKPCNGECTEEGTHCKGCGRTHEEIAGMKKRVGELADYARHMEYENLETFVNAVANGLKYNLGLIKH